MSTLSAVELQAVREQIIRTNVELEAKVKETSRICELIEQLGEKVDRLEEISQTFGRRPRVRS
jgi:acetoacetate decarboxylase